MKWNKEMKTAVFFACFAVFYLIMTSQIPTMNLFSAAGLDSKSLPHVYGVVMLVLSALLFVSAWRKQKQSGVQEAPKKPVTMVTVFGRQVPRKPLYLTLSILLFAFYAATYISLGFILSGIIYLGCMICLLTPSDKRSKKTFAFEWVFSVVFVVALYEIFTRALSMMLPRGILG